MGKKVEKKIAVNCQQCGKQFETWENWIKRGGGKFCSRSCSAKNRIGPKSARYNRSTFWSCKMCGVNKLSSPSKVQVFCSMECRSKWNSIYIKGKSHHNYKEPIKIICEICKEEFKARPFAKDKRFCSRSCRNIWFGIFAKQRTTIPDNLRIYPLSFDRKFKTMIRQRDGFTCLLCGKNGYDVHHIDYNKNNTTPENCVTLCRQCHPKTNHNRDYWQNLIKQRMIENEYI